MVDFMRISVRSNKRGSVEIYPKFIINNHSQDLMIRGGDFYAIWLEEKKLWSTDEQDAIDLIDSELKKFTEENAKKYDAHVTTLYLWDSESKMIDSWHKYCQRQMRDNWHMLDAQLIFSNTPTTKKSYASKCLSYPLEEGGHEAYDRLMSVLYSDEERRKIEWAIGSIVKGDSKKLQKFMVLYGAAGTGKSTVLNIIQDLFEGYYCVFDAKSLGSSSNSFALEAFKTNPLVAIQHDGDLSHIEDNTRLNSLVAHEKMTVNAKFEKLYSQSFNSFLFMGTNKVVRITDAKSGLIRRLIDVSPTGEKVNSMEYKALTSRIKYELGAIAYHCKQVYEEDPDRYDNYIPVKMLGASNDFYNFVSDSYFVFKKQDKITLKQAWEMYKTYCSDANVPYPFSQRIFREELKNYFEDFQDRAVDDDGERVRSLYSGFKLDDFESGKQRVNEDTDNTWLTFTKRKSEFDKTHPDVPAQLTNEDGKPLRKWSEVTTTLSELDTSELHYCKMPKQEVVVDFDIPDESGNKSLKANLEAASKWPPTYAELSKSGQGIHLHYIWEGGDVADLEHEFAPHVEIKTFRGNASLRRKLTKCNGLSISHINAGLPIKKGEKVVNEEVIKSEKGLRSLIGRNLRKEIHPGTKPSIDFINKILEDAYNSDLSYDVTDLKNAVISFAASSTHQSDYCLKLVSKMHFKSADPRDNTEKDGPIIFYDVEVFPNLFLVNYKQEGEGIACTRMINPTPTQIEGLMKYRLVGFNCRRYDNHIMYARLMGYTNEELYHLSQNIISGQKNCFFGEAYNLSYTDVYDFCSTKQSLKKWEIALANEHSIRLNKIHSLINSGYSIEEIAKEINYDPALINKWLEDEKNGVSIIHHQELGLPWDQPVPEDKWIKVAEYCDNDVIATEAVWNARKADFTARQILADVAGMTVNDTTNSLTTKIIFGNNRKPQDQFNYRFMGCDIGPTDEHEKVVYTRFDKGKPLFPGYSFKNGVSTYRGEEVGEGGYVYAEPGIYHNVALLDIASMHPSSIVAEELFGKEYTKRFNDILQARIAIKHKDFDKAKKMLGGVLSKYLDDEKVAKDLAQALKIAINSVYGLTSAKFDNPFRDPRNVDNIVAKRGALFMVNLKHAVQSQGFTVAHIKTDSIKIPDATPEIIQFVMDYGKQYGYNFEHEATYEKMCLVNDAVYIAKYKDGDWTATGTQFAVPYVYKTLFTHEPIEFADLCETKSVSTAIYLDMNESLPDVTEEEKQYKDIDLKFRKGLVNDTTFENESKKLQQVIEKGHNYIFIGKVGSFCPIKPGCGGGELFRDKDGKMYSVANTKGWRWLEAGMVKKLGKEDDIDMDYYQSLAQEAIDTIQQYGDFGVFVGDEFMNTPQ